MAYTSSSSAPREGAAQFKSSNIVASVRLLLCLTVRGGGGAATKRAARRAASSECVSTVTRRWWRSARKLIRTTPQRAGSPVVRAVAMDVEAAGEPAAKRQRAAEPVDPQSIVCLNLDGLKARVLAKERDRGDAAARSLARLHARALVSHLCSVTEAPPDVIFLSEVQLRARSAQRQGELEQTGTGSRADQAQAQSALDAWDALVSCPELSGYTSYRSLHATQRGKAGVCALLRPGVVPLSVRFSLDAGAPPAAHHPEGRVLLLEFSTLRLLLTYSPNQGVTPESHQRRANFDAQLLALVSSVDGKPLIWAGDLNVSPTADDYIGAAIKPGLAGTTPQEQARFASILFAGDMRDAWRCLNPGVRGGWTWRGAAWLTNCAMRLDHFVVSNALWSRVRRVEAVAPAAGGALTRGPRNGPEAHYFGSDHWPLFLELAPKEGAAGAD